MSNTAIPMGTMTALEEGLSSALPKTNLGDVVEVENSKSFEHSDKQLLNRAREINANETFVFASFSEVNTFFLLRTQDELSKLQNKLEDSIRGTAAWTEEESDILQRKLEKYCILMSVIASLMIDQALAMQKTILEWERPPFKMRHSVEEFLEPSPPEPPTEPNLASVTIRPLKKSVKKFDGRDYIDLCPQNSSLINRFLRSFLREHFFYHPPQRKVIATLHGRNSGLHSLLSKNILILDNPVWRGSSASVTALRRVLVSLISVGFLIVPMIVLTYIEPRGFILLAATLFSVFFAVVFAMCSRARSHEVWAVTAAYAAVLVVFVGNAVQNKSISV